MLWYTVTSGPEATWLQFDLVVFIQWKIKKKNKKQILKQIFMNGRMDQKYKWTIRMSDTFNKFFSNNDTDNTDRVLIVFLIVWDEQFFNS